MPLIFNICSASEWAQAEARGHFEGSPVDLDDGFIHFSSADQVAETAARHFAGRPDLVLIAVPSDALGSALHWEPSRGGALFPHLYGMLSVAAVSSVDPLPLGPAGRHVFSAGAADP